ncbi:MULTISPECIES: flagellar hook-basal body complex protein [Pseudoxanthomonas]|uniref:Flagellar hook protein FlgE n=1 Tax=Pseudoxanthomonas winnipegensis TaxID=2480810 RepID=A0AAW8GED4_9GAMM|nr:MULTISPECIES: flagellar hook-basal body complex protein [Pseudoxanthomonas]MDQ1120662.1 flagellar hook protein FlgE [Pseudoxanthomonas winnipegensis]MDQ1133886.1 flagellar hook protein FlgE [Pseudoxanthomonas winnipegensis]MDR6139878.1 flagellar hook protein FlgE [Pseudoxanthomonas sp. SORGH_AS_0997]
MFQAIFNSLSGLFSFSKSLDTVSNNIANMNTPGFRGSDSFFSNLGEEHGTKIVGEGLRTSEGDIRQTSNGTDVAINGSGFFVLRDANGVVHYTRAGQFVFNDAGLLIDSATKFQVMGLEDGGVLAPISIDAYRTLPAQATTSVTFAGNLKSGQSSPFTVSDIKVYDADGNTHTLKATFTESSSVVSGRFLVSVQDETGKEVAPAGAEIRFSSSGSLVAGYSSVSLDLAYGDKRQSIDASFGTPGTFSGATSLPGLSSSLTATVADGRPTQGISGLSFDEAGALKISYGDGEDKRGPRLALAAFLNESSLRMDAGRLISNVDARTRTLGYAGEGALGKIQGKSLEMSNVDLTQEFADMLIIQRGYQASSRVMTVSNEMVEQLYNSVSR